MFMWSEKTVNCLSPMLPQITNENKPQSKTKAKLEKMLLLTISGLILIFYNNFLQKNCFHVYDVIRCLPSATWNCIVLRYFCLLVGEVRDWVRGSHLHLHLRENNLHLKISTPDFPNKQTDSSLSYLHI